VLLPTACLEPPEGTGDLNARALWPQAFVKGGGGLGNVIAALKVYLAEGYARCEGVQDDAAKADESARQWARFRAFRQAYERMLVSASSVSTSDGNSASVLLTQIQDTLAYANAALAASNEALGAAVEGVTRQFVPRSAQSGSSELVRRW
jgi:hypothetical protein